ncbi:hypothetical protein ATCC90586_002669 [Pythium insidiosum]|nr:hypothetical protein ATCC90586_002669 [Pythium insidiosum]
MSAVAGLEAESASMRGLPGCDVDPLRPIDGMEMNTIGACHKRLSDKLQATPLSATTATLSDDDSLSGPHDPDEAQQTQPEHDVVSDKDAQDQEPELQRQHECVSAELLVLRIKILETRSEECEWLFSSITSQHDAECQELTSAINQRKFLEEGSLQAKLSVVIQQEDPFFASPDKLFEAQPQIKQLELQLMSLESALAAMEQRAEAHEAAYVVPAEPTPLVKRSSFRERKEVDECLLQSSRSCLVKRRLQAAKEAKEDRTLGAEVRNANYARCIRDAADDITDDIIVLWAAPHRSVSSHESQWERKRAISGICPSELAFPPDVASSVTAFMAMHEQEIRHRGFLPETLDALRAVEGDITPAGVVRTVMTAFRVLHRELVPVLVTPTVADSSESANDQHVTPPRRRPMRRTSCFLNADVLIPALVLLFSRVPRAVDLDVLWLRLQSVHAFRSVLLSDGCEEAYYVTCLTAAMEFVSTAALTSAQICRQCQQRRAQLDAFCKVELKSSPHEAAPPLAVPSPSSSRISWSSSQEKSVRRLSQWISEQPPLLDVASDSSSEEKLASLMPPYDFLWLA